MPSKNDGAVTIYHNPACGTSRKVLSRIEAEGITPTIVLYLQTNALHRALQPMICSRIARTIHSINKRRLTYNASRVFQQNFQDLGLSLRETDLSITQSSNQTVQVK